MCIISKMILKPLLCFSFQNLANRSLVDDTLRKVNGLKPIASELGVTLAQLGIAWCASNPNVSSVITGATKESQVYFTRLSVALDKKNSLPDAY
jgi:aryl-alcohol dehydrogenase-like predicted oxidoreductase